MEFDPVTIKLCEIILYGLAWFAIAGCVGGVGLFLYTGIKRIFCRAPKSGIGASTNSRYTPCPRFRCDWVCRIGYKCKCGGVACRVERHSV
jgi:hypothetical protein